MPNATIGEIEFLVKFDTMSSSFEEALKNVLEKTELKVDAKEKDDKVERVEERIDKLTEQIQRIFVTTGMADDYATFLAKVGNLKTYYGDPANWKKIGMGALKSEAMRKHLGITDTMGEEEVEEIATKFGENISSGILLQVSKAMKNPAYWEKVKGKLGKEITFTEAMVQGLRNADIGLDVFRSLFPETKVTEGMVETLQELGARYLAKVGKEHELSWSQEPGVGVGERFFRVLYPEKETIGKGEKTIETTQEFQAALRRAGLTHEQIIDLFVKDIKPEDLDDVMKKVLEENKLKRGLAVPKKAASVIEALFPEEQLFFKNIEKDLWSKKFGRPPEEGEKLSRAADLLYEILDEEVLEKLEEKYGKEHFAVTRGFFEEFGPFLGGMEAKITGGAVKSTFAGMEHISGTEAAGFIGGILKAAGAEEVAKNINLEKANEKLDKILQLMGEGLISKLSREGLEELVERLEDEIQERYDNE